MSEPEATPELKVYGIEQYELHAMTYYVRAASEAEAINKLWKQNEFPNDVIISDDGPELCEVDNTRGMPAEEHRELVAELVKLGHTISESHIDGIRAISEADEGEYDDWAFGDGDPPPCL